MALSVPLSRFASRVGGGSAFFVRHRSHAMKQKPPSVHFGFTGEIFGGTILGIGIGILVAIGFIKSPDSLIVSLPVLGVSAFACIVAGSIVARVARLRRLSADDSDNERHDA